MVVFSGNAKVKFSIAIFLRRFHKLKTSFPKFLPAIFLIFCPQITDKYFIISNTIVIKKYKVFFKNNGIFMVYLFNLQAY